MLSTQKIILIGLLFSFSPETFAAYKYSGSVSFSVSQRFFSDKNFRANDDFSSGESFSFDKFPALQFEISLGLHEFSFGLEPIVGFSYITKTSNKIVAANGLTSEDKFKFSLITASAPRTNHLMLISRQNWIALFLRLRLFPRTLVEFYST